MNCECINIPFKEEIYGRQDASTWVWNDVCGCGVACLVDSTHFFFQYISTFTNIFFYIRVHPWFNKALRNFVSNFVIFSANLCYLTARAVMFCWSITQISAHVRTLIYVRSFVIMSNELRCMLPVKTIFFSELPCFVTSFWRRWHIGWTP